MMACFFSRKKSYHSLQCYKRVRKVPFWNKAVLEEENETWAVIWDVTEKILKSELFERLENLS